MLQSSRPRCLAFPGSETPGSFSSLKQIHYRVLNVGYVKTGPSMDRGLFYCRAGLMTFAASVRSLRARHQQVSE